MSRMTELREDWGKLISLWGILWSERRLFIKYVSIAVVIGMVYVFSVPKTYMTSVMLAPESSGSSLSGSMSSLASLAGVNLNGMSEDALVVDLYPSIVSSKDFLLPLLDIRVVSKENEIDTTYGEYLQNHQKSAWWGYPFKLIGWGMELILPSSSEPHKMVASSSAVKQLTAEETALCQALQGRISCVVENITGVLTVTVADQDATISAIMADSVVSRLNKFILDYRTRKARTDYEYVSALCETARKDYLRAQGEYAAFTASHTNIYAPDIKAREEYLQNESQLAYMTYSQLKTQQETSRARVLESTPVYTIVESAYVPHRAASPKKLLTLFAFVFLGGVAASCKLFYKYLLKGTNA